MNLGRGSPTARESAGLNGAESAVTKQADKPGTGCPRKARQTGATAQTPRSDLAARAFEGSDLNSNAA